jgi:hypothetical protein
MPVDAEGRGSARPAAAEAEAEASAAQLGTVAEEEAAVLAGSGSAGAWVSGQAMGRVGARGGFEIAVVLLGPPASPRATQRRR